jgi:hypothetical protein
MRSINSIALCATVALFSAITFAQQSNTTPDKQKVVDSSKPETARDSQANGPETARDDHRNTPETARDDPAKGPETATDQPPASDVRKAANAAKQHAASDKATSNKLR